jgi:hypothetical protein
VVDVAPVKLAVLNVFDLVLGVGTATEDLGAFPAVRVDPACLTTAFAKFYGYEPFKSRPFPASALSRYPASGAS